MIGHWLDSDFHYHERVLEFGEIYGPHTGENIAELLHSTLEELELEHKILTITADNATNNESLISELYFNFKEKFHGVGEADAFH